MAIYDSILITGGGGMLAHALIRSLSVRGHRPIALTRAQLDIANPFAVQQAVEQHRPTLILNCAAHTKVDMCEEQSDLASKINGVGASNIARAARAGGAKLVHYSTDFVFNGQSSRPYREDDPTGPVSVYGETKLLGEHAIAKAGGEHWLILRTAWLYGPGGPCFPQTMINAARAGKPLKVVDDQVGSPTFTYDLAEATLNLIDANARGIYHVTNTGQTSWHDFTAAILDEFGLATDLSRTTSAEWKKLRPNSAIRPAYSVMDTSKYTQATGKTPKPWRDALREYRNAIETTV